LRKSRPYGGAAIPEKLSKFCGQGWYTVLGIKARIEVLKEPNEVLKESNKARKESNKAQKESNKVLKESNKVLKESNKARKESNKAQKESNKAQKESNKVQKESNKARKESNGTFGAGIEVLQQKNPPLEIIFFNRGNCRSTFFTQDYESSVTHLFSV
jgi:septal ring factor EnvC (AmiA/AmiB activator)